MTIARRSLLAWTVALGLAAPALPAAGAETLTVGAYPANPPWENKTPSGAFEGFEVDLANEIGRRLGMPIDFQDLGFQALFAATASGRIDFAISSISITNDRLKNQAFTQGYYDSDMALIAKDDTAIKDLGGLKGKTVGAIATSVGEAWIKANTVKYGIGDYRSYTTQQYLLLDTQSGRVDGAVGDIAGFQVAFDSMKGMKIVEKIPTGDKFGIMMRKGSPLLAKVDAAISAIKKDGTLGKLHERWLGSPAAPDSAVNTVLPIPQAQ